MLAITVTKLFIAFLLILALIGIGAGLFVAFDTWNENTEKEEQNYNEDDNDWWI